jgi:hypothetical protein
MGNSNSTAAAEGGGADVPAFTGKLGPRVQAITEGGRKGRASVKLPPKAVKSSPEDWPFIEVQALLSSLASMHGDTTSPNHSDVIS